VIIIRPIHAPLLSDLNMQLFSDGACSGNPGPGGWGVVLIKHNRILKESSGFSPKTTNNRMELQAAIEGIKLAKNHSKIFTLFTDSIYVKEGITKWYFAWQKNNWKGGKVKNTDLWMLLYQESHLCQIDWQWIKGHSGQIYNERADYLARQAIKTILDNQ
jgi:ribonuclease HI